MQVSSGIPVAKRPVFLSAAPRTTIIILFDQRGLRNNRSLAYYHHFSINIIINHRESWVLGFFVWCIQLVKNCWWDAIVILHMQTNKPCSESELFLELILFSFAWRRLIMNPINFWFFPAIKKILATNNKRSRIRIVIILIIRQHIHAHIHRISYN